MWGYYTDYGYLGIVGDELMLFATDTEYYEFIFERSVSNEVGDEENR